MREPGVTDIHDYKRRLERAVKFLGAHPKVKEQNKTLIMQFIDRLKAEGLSVARQAGYVQRLTTIAVILAKDFDKAEQPDVEQLIKAVNARDWAEWTKENYRVTVKRFWRWLKKLPKGKDPTETEWITIGKAESRTVLPEDLLTREEIQKLIHAAAHPRDKAYVAVASESGARPGEVLTLRVRSITFDEYGAVIVVRGKKGERRIRLVVSAPYLAAWLDIHPHRQNPDAPVWVNIGTTNHGHPYDYYAARKLLRELALRAHVGKRVNPYSFRHSQATYMANFLTEAQMCEFFGWKQGSKMPSVYVRLSGRDIDNKLLELHGLKPKQNEKVEETVKVCARCQVRNPPASKFCSRCGSALSIKAALEADQRIGKAEEIMETLLEDSEVKVFLMNKMRQLGLAGALA
jgi:integrase/ribosomal protein L40E